MLKKVLHLIFSLAAVSSLLLFNLTAGCQPTQPAAIPTTDTQTLRLYDTDPSTLDPAISSDATSHQYIVQLFSGLVRLDDNLEPVPDIAEKWEISNDGRTYTFFLRHDVKFHDGQGVKAADFEYSWQRAVNPATGSLTAATYLGDISGVNDVLAGKGQVISGVRIVDDYTLEVTTDTPKSYFLFKLTYPTAFVVDKTNVESGAEWWRNPNGTGPFKLKQWNQNALLVFEKNSLYYGEQAKVNSVVFYLWGGVPMNMYEMGQIDAAGVSVEYIDKITDKTGPFYNELSITPELGFYYIGFNAGKPPFDDVNIRRAFTMAIDKDKLVSLIYRDTMQKADGILPPGIPGYNKSLAGLDYDVAKAKELIRESKYGDASKLPPITITTSGWGGLISQSLEAIIYQWKQNLGVDVTVRLIEPDRFFYHLKEEKDEMFEMGWIADYPHPQDFLDVLFHTGAANNYGDYGNPEIDALLDKAGIEMDTGLSMPLYQQAEQKLVDDAACIPLWFGRNYVLARPYVKGYDLNPLGIALLNRVSLGPH